MARKGLDFVLGVCLAVALATGSASAADKVKFTLNFAADPGHAAYIYAQKQGYYRDAGIDLEIEQGRGSGSTVQLVAAGQTDVGLADAGVIVNLAARGAPVKIIGIIEQLSSWAVIVREDSPIKTPKDLEGRKLGVVPGTAQRALLGAMAGAQGVDVAKIDIVNFDAAASLSMLGEGRVDAVIDVPDIMFPRLKDRGIPVRALYMRDFKVPLVSMSLVVTEKMLQERPDVVRRFVAATLKGIKATMENPAAAVSALLEVYPDAGKRDAALFTVTERAKNNYCAPDSVGLGLPSQKYLDASYEVMTKFMGVSSDKPFSAYFDTAYLPNPPLVCATK
ncbi:ABC transporter substrate-binding protein [Telmatospirillum sp.]|uniref:ABC transporter substrate-binding protein n=1 Tax=Telmatospirillum sp. TaxID=2079197 RepID=UPI0028468E2E|nr:ABC transporter substrate-binding protein [Telmatospirillum sp.]MDR3439387.1 ABC transporter substrate-binding protein [Telmatospirillum sp.]